MSTVNYSVTNYRKKFLVTIFSILVHCVKSYMVKVPPNVYNFLAYMLNLYHVTGLLLHIST